MAVQLAYLKYSLEKIVTIREMASTFIFSPQNIHFLVFGLDVW